MHIFPTLDADANAKSDGNEAVELDDVPHEYAEVWEVDNRDTGNVMKLQPLHRFWLLSLM